MITTEVLIAAAFPLGIALAVLFVYRKSVFNFKKRS